MLALVSPFASAPLHAHGGSHAHASKPVKAKGGDFTLVSAAGPVSLRDFRGKVVALYFGYSSCADLCPMSLASLADALAKLTPEDAAQVQALFVTVDPTRDDAARLAAYASGFDPRLIGLTGNPKRLRAAARAYGIDPVKGKTNAAGGYDFDHASVIHIIGRDGKLRRALEHGAPPVRIAAEMRRELVAAR
jgi:protein SCO1/2